MSTIAIVLLSIYFGYGFIIACASAYKWNNEPAQKYEFGYKYQEFSIPKKLLVFFLIVVTAIPSTIFSIFKALFIS